MMKQQHRLFRRLLIAFFIIFTFSGLTGIFAQTPRNDKEVTQAIDFIRQNRMIDALPLLENAVKRYPNDAELLGHLGIAILARSSSIKDEVLRKKEVYRGQEILKKADKLGSKNVMVLHYLEMLERGDGEIDAISGAASKEVEEAIREGEDLFGRGEFDKAFLAYERASRLDPKSYEAALFAGDCFYSQKKI